MALNWILGVLLACSSLKAERRSFRHKEKSSELTVYSDLLLNKYKRQLFNKQDVSVKKAPVFFSDFLLLFIECTTFSRSFT